MDPRQIEKVARELIEGWKLEPGTKLGALELDTASIARWFYYYIDVAHRPIENQTRRKPHLSKLWGRPWMAPESEWPEGYYFFAHFDLAALKPLDATGMLPPEGLLYLFFNPLTKDFLPASTEATRGRHYVDPVETLELRAFPPKGFFPQDGKYYFDDFKKRSYELSYKPAFSFHPFEGLPADLIAALEERLEIPYVAQPDCTVFGKPLTWQGESDLFAPLDWDWSEGSPPDSQEDRVLLFQTGFGDGQFHFWLKPERLAKGDFSAIETTASVT